MRLGSTLLESGYCSPYPFRQKGRGFACQTATISASALNGDWPASSSWQAARRIFSGTVVSTIVFTSRPIRSTKPGKCAGMNDSCVYRPSRPAIIAALTQFPRMGDASFPTIGVRDSLASLGVGLIHLHDLSQ